MTREKRRRKTVRVGFAKAGDRLDRADEERQNFGERGGTFVVFFLYIFSRLFKIKFFDLKGGKKKKEPPRHERE